LEQTVGGLNQGATYYFRAYAFVAPDSVAYSNELVYTVPIDPAAVHTCGSIGVHNSNLNYGSLTDQEGNVYKTIVIGNQEWMAENLNTSIYRNGDPIENVVDGSQWANLSTGAWCYYNNDNQFECPYGKLYNWYAVADPRNVCPTGWHVPSDGEWTVLTDYLGIEAGGKMKSVGLNYWLQPNFNATNESGFSGLPGGLVWSSSAFSAAGDEGLWWSSSEYGIDSAWFRYLNYSYSSVSIYYDSKQNGFSVRCLRD
jgi:uncharacterized protein (TIGR02145 family)